MKMEEAVVEAGYFAFQFFAAAATLVVAGWVFYLDPGRSQNRVLALLLFLRGLRNFSRTMSLMLGNDPDALFWLNLRGYFDLATVPVVAYFAVVGLTRERGIRLPAFVVCLVVGLGSELLYAYDHCVEVCYGTRLRGPLSMLTSSVGAAFAIVALFFARRFAQGPEDAKGKAALFVSAGLTLNALLDSSALMAATVHVGPAAIVALNGGGAYIWYFLAAQAVAFVLSLVNAAVWWTAGASTEFGRIARTRLVGLALAVIASGTIVEIIDHVEAVSLFVTMFIFGVWRLALPLLIVYAVVKHQLFDLEWKIRIGLGRGTLAGLALAAFFIVTQGLETLFQSAISSDQPALKYLGAAAVGLAVVFLHPLQRLTNKWAAKGVPKAKPMDDLSSNERLALYDDHARLAWEDGHMQRKERLLLDHLRERLGISLEDAARLERRYVS